MRITLIVAFALVPAAAAAHVGVHPETNLWALWQFTPDIAAGTLLVAAFYIAGLRQRLPRERQAAAWLRACSFFFGLASIFLALQSPIDAISEHVFAVHQIQHLLLRSVGPMLLMLAAPQTTLIAGLPDAVRRAMLAPLMANGIVRTVFQFLARPTVATLVFVGALCFWQLPAFHDLAVLNDGTHYLMHVTLLLSGLIFFWRVLDRRPVPPGARCGARLAMLFSALIANIIIGAPLTFKHAVLYDAYDRLGRFWDMTALQDERIGALIIWIPGSMMCVIAALIVIELWGRHETRLDDRRQRGLPPATAAVTAAKGSGGIASRNRSTALRLAALALAVVAVLVTVVAIVTETTGLAGLRTG